jgi:enamine deaminase RidA (YjgF/YER057c/UK114 family)
MGVDLHTGELVVGIARQTRAALQHVETLLAAVGATGQDVLSLRVHLATDDDFNEMDEAMGSYLRANFPPRTTVSAGLAPGALVEIDAFAVLP